MQVSLNKAKHHKASICDFQRWESNNTAVHGFSDRGYLL